MHTPAFWYHPTPTLLTHVLRPLSWLYSALSSLHRTWRGHIPYQAPAPVISIGNLTVGGSGKTPLVELITRHFAKTHKVAVVVGAYATDEARQLTQALPNATIICHPNKRVGVQQAVAAGATLILLDDGFSRADIARDIDILTFGPQGLGNGLLLPAGPLREPTSAAARASLYVLQDCPLPVSLPPKPTFALTRALHAPTLAKLKGKPLVAFAGIAHPEAFFNQLRAAGLNLMATVPLPDHAPFPPALLHRLQTLATHNRATLVCTAKDSPKLPAIFPHTAIPLVLGGETSALLSQISQMLIHP